MTDIENKQRRGRPRAFDRATALARAMEVFWAAGYEGASIPMLSAAMGISAQSLYAAFVSKDALYREAIALYKDSMGGFGTRALSEEADVLTALSRLVHEAAVVFSRTPASPGCMITMAPSGQADDALITFGRQLRSDSVHQITERMARGVREGQLRDDTDCAAWARYIVSVVQGLSVQARDAIPTEALLSTARIVAQSLNILRR